MPCQLKLLVSLKRPGINNEKLSENMNLCPKNSMKGYVNSNNQTVFRNPLSNKTSFKRVKKPTEASNQHFHCVSVRDEREQNRNKGCAKGHTNGELVHMQTK